jgi:hypothetical protein
VEFVRPSSLSFGGTIGLKCVNTENLFGMWCFYKFRKRDNADPNIISNVHAIDKRMC